MYAADQCGNDAMYPKDSKKRADVSGRLITSLARDSY